MSERTAGGRPPGRVAIVSAMRHARDYASALDAHPELILTAVAENAEAGEPALGEARALAAAHGVPVMALHELDPDRFEAAVVCTEPTRHAPTALHLLDRGLDLLIDKPVATSVADARSIRSALRASGRHCAVVNRARSGPVQRLRQTVERGEIGLPRSIDIEFLASQRHLATSVERLELVTDPKLSGGGEVMNFLGYAVDMVREITGCDPLDVMAETTTAFSEAHARHGVEDLGVVSLGCTNGLTATVTVGRVPAAPATTPVASSIRLIGSHDAISVRTESTGVHLYGADGTDQELRLPGHGPDAVVATLDDVAEMVRTGDTPPYSIDDALLALATIEAAYAAARTGRVVAVTH